MSGSQALLLALVALGVFTAGLYLGSGLTLRRAPGRDAPGTPGGRVDGSPGDGAERDAEGTVPAVEALLARVSHALDSIEQGVILFDRDGTELLRNRTARQYAEARDPLVLVDAAVQDLLGPALAGRTEQRAVEIFGPPAQSFLVTVAPYEDDPGAGALAIVHDRSLQRRTETVRRDFVANISHELKTPIGALGLLAETIREEPDDEVVERLAERMIVEADRASSTVDDLLELTRIEFGDEAEFEPVPISSVVGEATSRIGSAAEHAGIDVSVEVPAELRVFGDRRQLVSALTNLLDNSVKYSPEGAEVIVSAEPAGDHVLVRVEDTGIGIPRRDLDRIFERFYRVDRARSRRTGGTGLGLAIVRHVVSNHHGSVSVESTEGVGSVFTLTLPGEP